VGLFILDWFSNGYRIFDGYTTIVIILPLCLYYLYIRREKWSIRWFRSITLPFALSGFIPLIILMIYNTLIFRNPFSIGYKHLGNQFQESMSQGFLGISWPRHDVLFYLTFQPAKGIFWQSPVLLMAVFGFFFLWRISATTSKASLS
jgi:hypothetical protein